MVKKIIESEDYGYNGKGAKTIKVSPAYARNGDTTYYTVQSEIDRLHDDHSERIWCTDSKGNIKDGWVEAGWTFSIDMIDPVWLKRHGFELNESRNRVIEKSYSPNGARYEIICYYGPDFRGYKMSDETDSYDELKELAWDYINNGCVEIIDNKTGKRVRYTEPDEIYYDGEIYLGI